MKNEIFGLIFHYIIVSIFLGLLILAKMDIIVIIMMSAFSILGLALNTKKYLRKNESKNPKINK